MFRASDTFTTGGSPYLRHKPHDNCVAFELTVPGLTSAPARALLIHAFGDSVSAYVVNTDRRRDSTTLYVETDNADINVVIGKLIAFFPRATLGRVTRVTRHRTMDTARIK